MRHGKRVQSRFEVVSRIDHAMRLLLLATTTTVLDDGLLLRLRHLRLALLAILLFDCLLMGLLRVLLRH